MAPQPLLEHSPNTGSIGNSSGGGKWLPSLCGRGGGEETRGEERRGEEESRGEQRRGERGERRGEESRILVTVCFFGKEGAESL